MAVNVPLLCVTCFISTLAVADHVPVLIWSSDRPLNDLPNAAGSVSRETFYSDYLTPLLDKVAPVLVVFLQDKLHINDISKYADVYKPDSEGGAFKHVKAHLDRHFSLELPHVENSHMALHALRQDFPGTVLDIKDTSDLGDLHLQGEGFSLVIVSLQSVVDAPHEEAAIAANDNMIGKISRHLEEQDVKYTALYTAEASQSEQREKRETRLSRRLLQAPDVDKAGAFYNISYPSGTLYAYLTSVSACVRPPFNTPLHYCPFNFTVHNLSSSDMSVKVDGSRTLNLTLTIPNIQPRNSSGLCNFKLTMPIRHQQDRWEILESRVTITNLSGNMTVQDFELVTEGYDTVIPLLYSFHCTSMVWNPKNMDSRTLAYIVLGGFQVQPFNTPSSGFFLSQDCVGWFTAPIWMALIPVAIHVLILFFGLYMLASLTTNDRFDDPKGKPLTIHAAE